MYPSGLSGDGPTILHSGHGEAKSKMQWGEEETLLEQSRAETDQIHGVPDTSKMSHLGVSIVAWP